MEYIFDGEVHALDYKMAYVCEFVEDEIETKLTQYTDKLIEKYIIYLYENNKEECISLIKEYFKINGFCSEKYCIGFKPKWATGSLEQKANIYIKFMRCENDNLNKETE